MEGLRHLEVVKIGRNKNNTHELAQLAISSSRSQIFFSSFPEFVQSLICTDAT